MNNSTKATIPIEIFNNIFRLIMHQICHYLSLKPLQNSGKNLQHSHISIVRFCFFQLRSSVALSPRLPIAPSPDSRLRSSDFGLSFDMLPSIRFATQGARLRSPASCLPSSVFRLSKCVNHVILSKSSVTATQQLQYNLVLIKLIINFEIKSVNHENKSDQTRTNCRGL